MSFMDSLHEVGKKVSTSMSDQKAEEDAFLIRKYFPEIQQALASGLGEAGFKVVVHEDPNAPAMVDLGSKIIQVPTIAEGDYRRIALARGFIDHELGHVRYTERSKVRPPKGDNLYPLVANLLEDMRCDRKTVEDLPGTQSNLSQMFSIVKEEMKKQHEGAPKEMKDLYELFENVYSNGALQLDEDISEDNVFKSLVDKYAQMPLHSTTNARQAAKKMCDDIRSIVKDIEPPKPPEGPGDGEGEGEGESESESSGSKDSSGKDKGKSDDGSGEKGETEEEEEEGSGSGSGDSEDEEDGEGEGSGDSEDSDGPDSDEETDALGEAKPHENSIADHGEKKHSSSDEESKYDPSKHNQMTPELFESLLNDVEFDMSEIVKNEFKSDKDVVMYERYTTSDERDMEVVLPAAKDLWYMDKATKDLQRVQGHMMAQMVRMYKQERPMPKRRQPKGSIESAAIYRAFLNEEDLFIKKVRQDAYNIAYTLLIDLSGSMCGSKLTTAIQAAAIFGKVLDNLNIPTEILGFTTDDFRSPKKTEGKVDIRRTIPLRHYVFKGFNEKMNWVVNGRMETILSNSGLCCHNVDGEAVEWAAKRLNSRREQKKVMIVMSDGMPEDGKGSGVLHRHLTEVIQYYMKRQMILIGLGIMTSSVKSFYPDYAVLNNIQELPKVLLSKVESKLSK